MAKRTPKSPAPEEVFADRLAEVRKAKGWSQERLADRVSEAGHKMHQTTIAKIEGKRRSVGLAELMAFAWALEVSPVALMLPRDPDAMVQAAPNVVAPTREFRR